MFGGIVLLAVVFILVVLIFACWYINVFLPFLNEKRSIELEIDTNDGEEKLYWKKELKTFYSERFPFCGRLLYKIFTKKGKREGM